jgi:cobalt/nickel transport system permease protein
MSNATSGQRGRSGSRRVTTTAFVLVGLATAVLLAFLVAPRANPNPDGLERVAIDHGLDSGVTEHASAGSPFADYGVEGVDNPTLGTGTSGVVGIAATFAIGTGAVYLLRRSRRHQPAPAPPVAA